MKYKIWCEECEGTGYDLVISTENPVRCAYCKGLGYQLKELYEKDPDQSKLIEGKVNGNT